MEEFIKLERIERKRGKPQAAGENSISGMLLKNINYHKHTDHGPTERKENKPCKINKIATTSTPTSLISQERTANYSAWYYVHSTSAPSPERSTGHADRWQWIHIKPPIKTLSFTTSDEHRNPTSTSKSLYFYSPLLQPSGVQNDIKLWKCTGCA